MKGFFGRRGALAAVAVLGVFGSMPTLASAAVGSLTQRQLLLNPGFTGLQDVDLAPGDAHVYTLARDGRVNVFARDAGTGDVSLFEEDPTSVATAYLNGTEAEVEIPGTHLLATGGDGLHVYARDLATGAVTHQSSFLDGVNGISGLGGSSALATSPDGTLIYVAGSADDAIVVFNRVTGGTSPGIFYLETELANGGLTLSEVRELQVSPNGAQLYAGTDENGKIERFDQAGGFLTYVGPIGDGTGGTNLVFGPFGTSLALSANGEDLYSNAYDPVSDRTGLAQLARDTSTGALSVVEFLTDGLNGNDGIEDVEQVVLSGDGRSLYAISRAENAVAVYDRNAETGRLSYVEKHRDSDGQIDGLLNPRGLAASSDAKSVYIATRNDRRVGTLTHWSRQLGADPPAPVDPPDPVTPQSLDVDLSSLRTRNLKDLSAAVECSRPCVAQVLAEGKAGSVRLKSGLVERSLAADEKTRIALDFKKKKLKAAAGKTAELVITLNASADGSSDSDDAEIEVD